MQNVLFILEELTDDDIDWMIARGSRQEIAAETTLIQQGQAVDALYILLGGTLSVSIANPAGEEKEITRLSTGEVVGEISFVDALPPSATVKAITDCLVLAISSEELATKLQLDIGFSSRFYRAMALLLATRLRGTVNQLGYSKIAGANQQQELGQLEPFTSGELVLAKARFDWLLLRLRGS